MIPEPHSPVTPVAATADLEARLVAPRVDADHLDRGLQRLRVDAHALHRAGRRPLPAADLGAFERRSRRARRGELVAMVAEHDLGVRADVDDELHLVAAMRPLGEDHRRGVGADVAGDARAGVERGERQVELEVGGGAGHGGARRQRERCAAEWRRVDAEHEVVHDRVADDHDVEHPITAHVGGGEQLADQLVDRVADGSGELRDRRRGSSSRRTPGS